VRACVTAHASMCDVIISIRVTKNMSANLNMDTLILKLGIMNLRIIRLKSHIEKNISLEYCSLKQKMIIINIIYILFYYHEKSSLKYLQEEQS